MSNRSYEHGVQLVSGQPASLAMPQLLYDFSPLCLFKCVQLVSGSATIIEANPPTAPSSLLSTLTMMKPLSLCLSSSVLGRPVQIR